MRRPNPPSRPSFLLALLAGFALAVPALVMAAPTNDAPATRKANQESPVVVIRVVLKVKPDRNEAFVAAMASDAELTRKLDGCERFALYKDIGVPNAYLLYEEWASMKAFDAYRTSKRFQAAGRVLFPMMAGKPDSAYFEAQQVGPG